MVGGCGACAASCNAVVRLTGTSGPYVTVLETSDDADATCCCAEGTKKTIVANRRKKAMAERRSGAGKLDMTLRPYRAKYDKTTVWRYKTWLRRQKGPFGLRRNKPPGPSG